MFLKPYKVRSNSTLNGSKVEKLKQRIQEEFLNINPDVLITSKSNINVLKLVTHGNVRTNAYCVDKLPLFFENEDYKLVPTLYSLWMVPDMLPFFTTFFWNLPKMHNGADLMLSGVIPQGIGKNIYGQHKSGQLVAVNLTSNKYAIGVGYLPISSDDLYMRGGHGIAVKMLHVFGDKLWGHEPLLAKQIPQFKSVQTTDESSPILRLNLSSNKLQPLIEKESSELEKINSKELLLKHAFLSALKNNGKSLQLPLLTSNFYRVYVVPESGEPIDLKKTRYKKLSNFLNEMVGQRLIVIRQETRGVDKITSINFEHPELVNFITDFKKSERCTSKWSETVLFHSDLMDLYIITDVTAPLFAKLNYKRGSGIPPSQIKKVIRDYINKQNLKASKVSSFKDRAYILDECLGELCKSETASFSEIIKAVISQMDHSYQMGTNNDFKGCKTQIKILTKGTSKKVTLVKNIEYYRIILTQFIKLCKRGAATGASIVTLPKQNSQMIRIQGNKARFVYNLLTKTYNIPKKYILDLDHDRLVPIHKIMRKRNKKIRKRKYKQKLLREKIRIEYLSFRLSITKKAQTIPKTNKHKPKRKKGMRTRLLPKPLSVYFPTCYSYLST